MTPAQLRLWNIIRIVPVKWELSPWGDPQGGFWVVAVFGSEVLWYNEIEGGFNRSRWSRFGVIDEYWCNDDELQWAVGRVLEAFETGERRGDRLGPPEPIE